MACVRRVLHGRLAPGLLCAIFALASVGQPIHAQQAEPPATESETATEPAKRVVVRFLTESDFPPFNFYDEDGVLTGFNVDLARAICLELGTACDIKVRPWGELIPALKRGEADAVVAGHMVSAVTLRDVDFTDRYFHTPGRFAVRRGEFDAEISPAGLDGKRVGVAKGTVHEAFLKAFFRDSSIQTFDTAEQARQALADGKVDIIFDDGIGLAFWLNGTMSRACCEFKGGPFLEPKFFGDGIAIAIRKNDSQIKSLINGALRKIRANGRFEELVQRYFPVRVY
jgi:polar amino acid transport system substrate-binding protein